MGEGFDGVFDAFALFADFVVGTDGKAMQGNVALLSPFGQGLREQRGAGDEEEDTLVCAYEVFGDLEAGEGFARAASRDELATVGALETREHEFVRGNLMLAQDFPLFEDRRLAGLILRPIDLAVFQILEIDLCDCGLLADECQLGIFRPVARGADNDAVRERLLAGCREEAVDVRLFDPIVFRVELTLNGIKLIGAAGLCYEVDASVSTIETSFLSPIGVEPNLRVKIGIGSFIAEVSANQLLKIGAFFPFGEGSGAVFFE